MSNNEAPNNPSQRLPAPSALNKYEQIVNPVLKSVLKVGLNKEDSTYAVAMEGAYVDGNGQCKQAGVIVAEGLTEDEMKQCLTALTVVMKVYGNCIIDSIVNKAKENRGILLLDGSMSGGSTPKKNIVNLDGTQFRR